MRYAISHAIPPPLFLIVFLKSIIFIDQQTCKPVDMKVFKHSD